MNTNEEIIRIRKDLDAACENANKVIERSDKIHESIMEKLDRFGEKLEEVKISIAELPDELTKRFDERYASKETETSLKRIMWIVITAIIVALLSLVIVENK